MRIPHTGTSLFLAAAALAVSGCDQSASQLLGAEGSGNPLSVVRGINHEKKRGDRERRRGRDRGPEFRSIDGSGNHQRDESLGAAHTQLARWAAPDYTDSVSAISGQGRASARLISNAVSAQSTSIPNPLGASDYLWQWGQFLDHDLDLTDAADPAEPAPIPVPTGDPHFDPTSTGSVTIPLNRSLYDTATGATTARQQINEITHWVDASNVYGSSDDRAQALRTNDGTGRLKTSSGNLLPFNTDALGNAGGPGATLFLAGDVRANEQVGLIAMHTLFVREHNRLVAELAAATPRMSGDELYERARRVVGAQMQAITYNEFLPALLGPGALTRYTGYRENTDARVSNLFSTAIYRFGHSALSTTLLRVDRDGNEIEQGHLPLRSAFFAPSLIVNDGGIEPILRGLAKQQCQAIDVFVIDDVRNFLFGPPGSGGFDLASLNIQRGRDHGIPSYNNVRRAMGLPSKASFAAVSSNLEVQNRLAAVYSSPDEMDVWVGALAEDPVNGGHLGELASAVVKRQFEGLRDGDRFWYETLPREVRDQVAGLKLSDIIRRNTNIGKEIPDDVFRVSR